MNLFLVGLSHKTAPIDVREKLDFSIDLSNQYLEKLSNTKSIQSGMVLSTCNRVEIYATAPEENVQESLKNFIYDFHKLKGINLDPYLYQKVNQDAIRHLFTVSSSLDSVVVGEPQILGQVKDAYDVSKKYGLIDSFFEHLLQKTFSVAKKIRNETDIGKLSVSISSVAVDLSSKIFESLTDKSALILGSGEMAELALAQLKRKGIHAVWIANRTFETAATLAKQYDCFPIYLEQFEEVLSQADIVIAATGINNYLITKEMVKKSLVARKQQPQLFIDISVPRNIDPSVDQLKNAYLSNIDHLKFMVEENQNSRIEASKKAEEIIELEMNRFVKEVEQKTFSPLIQQLQVKVGELFEKEWEKSFSKSIDPKAKEQFLKSVAQKMLHSPIQFLKNEEDSKNFQEKSELIKKIFDLDKND
jgi:glutamyl-tRNA reductase